MAAEEYYQGADQAQREARVALDESAMPRPQRINTDPTLGRGSPLPNGRRRVSVSAAEQSLQRSARRTSTTGSTDRPKTFADVRSPLQRLELTLDSISKEDKRARVEAAERAARDRAAAKGGAQQVRFRERRPSVAAGDAPATPITPTRSVQHSAGQNGPLTQNPPDEGPRQGAAPEPSPRAAPESRIPVPTQSGIPQRNLSFRERAARNDIKPPSMDSPASKEATPPGPSGRIPPRSGSNKLKKNPPDWPNRISESSEIFNTGEVTARTPQVVGGPAVTPNAGPPMQHQQQQQQQQHQYQYQQPHFESAARGPPSGGAQPRAPPREPDYLEDDFAELMAYQPPSGKLQKSPSQRKADQILGRTRAAADGPQQAVVARAMTAPAPTGNPPAYAAAMAAAPRPGAHGPEDNNSTSQRHHMSDFLYGRDRYQPGQGIFKPTPYLDEWKKATVGALSGGLLDLEQVPPAVEKTAAEKNATWWDAQSQSRRRSDSMSSRPIKAEAFEGEYDETSNGTRPPNQQALYPNIREVQSGDLRFLSTSVLSTSDFGGGLPYEPQHLASRRAKARAKRWDGLRPFSPSPSAASDSTDSLGCFSLCSNDATFSRQALSYSCTMTLLL
jgi:hypothetical protein